MPCNSRLYFHDSREPFALTVAGQKWYILGKAQDVTSTYMIDKYTMSYGIVAVKMMRIIGVSEDGIHKAFQTYDIENDGRKSTPSENLVRPCKEYQLE